MHFAHIAVMVGHQVCIKKAIDHILLFTNTKRSLAEARVIEFTKLNLALLSV